MANLANIGADARFVAIELTNFLSYKSARVDLGDFTALVGLNSSGKSNLVRAIRLLRSIPRGLPTALAMMGGFDQLRHRSAGRPNDPAIRVEFRFGAQPISSYEIHLGAVRGKRYVVKSESGEVFFAGGRFFFESNGSTVRWNANRGDDEISETPVLPGHSALASGLAGSIASYLIANALQSMQTVEINPAIIRDLQQPSSVATFEPDGSNVVSIYEVLEPHARAVLAEQLAAVVPGIVRIDVQNLADRQTLTFAQRTSSGTREFTARQMSDGTLRAFSILLAVAQPERPSMLVIEEPEMAIHLGAMRSLVEILRANTDVQFLITTHSADIIDSLPHESLRIVANDGSSSSISEVASHSLELLRNGLATPGELLRLDALDPA